VFFEHYLVACNFKIKADRKALPPVKKLRKSVNICQSYHKNKRVLFFYGPQCILQNTCTSLYINNGWTYSISKFKNFRDEKHPIDINKLQL